MSELEEPTQPVIPLPETFEETVGQYVKLRDALKKADDEHKKRMAPARDYLDRLGGALLDKLQKQGADSVKTGEGTVYKTTRRSATIRDGALFRQFVIEQEQYDLVDWRANALAVDDFIKEEKALPPGVDFSTSFVVGVRRK